MYPGIDKYVLQRLKCGYQAQAKPVPLSRYYARQKDKPALQLTKDYGRTTRTYVMVGPQQPECVKDPQQAGSSRPEEQGRYCDHCGFTLPLPQPVLKDDPTYNVSALHMYGFIQFMNKNDKATVGPLGSAGREAFKKEMLTRICYLCKDPYFATEVIDELMYMWETMYWEGPS